ncbi:hypothetical protein [Leptospira noguchii]|uniref:hypothetical protein n=1 Tax=Leptospira noguchii TaxID=28182 RepID=UPI0002BFB430|nr:hypothetical protein [Leptospira noguchii]EMI68199.1 hypothetical protein LEP1GSC072_4066 [Leptospira noguchii str. Bonito]
MGTLTKLEFYDQSLKLWELLQSSSFTINLWNCGNSYKVRVLRSIFGIVGTITKLELQINLWNCGNSYKVRITDQSLKLWELLQILKIRLKNLE